MIKSTLKEILDSFGSIQTLVGGKKMPPKAAYAVGKLARAVQSEIEQFYKTKEKIFTDAGCVVEPVKNEYIHPAEPTKLEEAKQAVEDLVGAEVELNALPLDIEQFGNAELDGNAFIGLDWAMKKD
jgi:hypothetical protein